MLRATRTRRLGPLAGMLLAMGCGARSSLRAPCEIALTRDEPVLVAVIEHSAGYVVTGPCDAGMGGPTRWDVLSTTFRQTLSALDEDVAMGAVLYPKAVPRPTRPGQDLSFLCELNHEEVISIGSRNAGPILRQIESVDRPSGGQPVFEALAAARRLLTEAPWNERQRLVVLGNFGAPLCNVSIPQERCECMEPVGDCWESLPNGISCNDVDRVETLIQTMRSEGIETFVIGMSCPASNFGIFIHNLDRMAIAGGLPRPDGPYRFYLSVEHDAIQRGVEDVVLPRAYCHLRAARPPQGDEALVLVDPDDRQIARDLTRRDGWDWTDTTHGRLELFGPACTSVARARRTLRLRTVDARCLP